MHPAKMTLISEIRSASRDLVREFGLMNKTVAGSDLSLSSAHAIIEIGRSHGMSSKTLCDKLLLEKSTVSRLVKSLIDRGEVLELRSENDLRMKCLHLTAQGKKTLIEIDRFAVSQVSNALDALDDCSQLGVLKGLRSYSSALKIASGHDIQAYSTELVNIHTGYVPAILGRIIEMLLPYMQQHFGFGVNFESRVAGDLAEFVTRLNSSQNQIWHAEFAGRIVGSITIDGEDLDDGIAHLRWFITDDVVRGGGVGRQLLSHALDFCDYAGFAETHLWTVKGLEAARNLYEKNGFELAEEYYGEQWGSRALEQKFVRKLPEFRGENI